ncbi:unnamed protein product [Allacma fusca]|uniref:ADP-ribosylation factor-like protein 6-interacting protein 4 n=1 Tax=Allacma fusca TaxID=39272 RepID=A0A8J2LT01_9HEXA|nr:unnamed protein product [Allacma fusca]
MELVNESGIFNFGVFPQPLVSARRDKTCVFRMSEKKLSRRSPTSDSESSTSSSSNSDSESSDGNLKGKGSEQNKKGKGTEHSNRAASFSSGDEKNGRTKKRRKLSGSDSDDRRSFRGGEVDSEDFSPLKKLGKFSKSIVKTSVSESKDDSNVSQRLPEINGDEFSSNTTTSKLDPRNKVQNSAVLEGLAVKTSESTYLHEKHSEARFEEFRKSRSVERSSRTRCKSSSSEPSRANASYVKRTEGVSQKKSTRKRSSSTSSKATSSSSEDSRDSPRRAGSRKAALSKSLTGSSLNDKSNHKSKSQMQETKRRGRDQRLSATNEDDSTRILSKSGEKESKSREHLLLSKKTSSRSPSDSSRSSSSDKTESRIKGNKTRRSRSNSGEKISKRQFTLRRDDKIREERKQHGSMERKHSKRDKRSSSAEKNHRSSYSRSLSRERRVGHRRRTSLSKDNYYRNQGRHRRSISRSRSPRHREMKSSNSSGRYAQRRSRRSNSRSRDSYHYRSKMLTSSRGRSRSREPIFSAYQTSKSSRNSKSSGEVISRRRTSCNSPNYERSSNHHGHRREGKADFSLVPYGSKDEITSDLKFNRDNKTRGNQSSRFSKDQTYPGKYISDSQKNSETRKVSNSSTPTKKDSRTDSTVAQSNDLRNSKTKPVKDSMDSSSSDSDSSTASDVRKKKKKSRERKSSKKSKKKKHKKTKKSESRKLKKKSQRKDKKKITSTPLSTPVQTKILAQDESKTIGPDPVKLIEESKKYAPKSQHEWEKEQSVIRKVVDDQTGRVRLIKGSGEVIESIVSKQQHKNINKAATKEDGLQFQLQLKPQLK